MKKILVITGELSGERQAAFLIREMKKYFPDTYFYGIGGENMASLGVELIYNFSQVCAMGIFEAIFKLPSLLQVRREIKNRLLTSRPDGIILVDFAEFNLNFAKIAKKLNIPVVYYFPPSAWAWRKSRAKKITKLVNRVICALPVEYEIYRKFGENVFYNGHPLRDIVQPSLTAEEIQRKYNLKSNAPIIGLLPGSREKEIDYILPLLVETMKIIKKERPQIQFVLPLAETIKEEKILSIIKDYPLQIIKGDTYNLISICDLVIACSGTVTLESALLGVPGIIIYRMNFLTYQLIKKMVHTKFIGLPNIIGGQEIYPEIIQKIDPFQLAKLSFKILDQNEQYRKKLKIIKEKIGSPGVIQRNAQLIWEVFAD